MLDPKNNTLTATPIIIIHTYLCCLGFWLHNGASFFYSYLKVIDIVGENVCYRCPNQRSVPAYWSSHGANCGVLCTDEYCHMPQSNFLQNSEPVCQPHHLGVLDPDENDSVGRTPEVWQKHLCYRGWTGK